MLAYPRQRFFPFLRASVPPCENPFYPLQSACPVAVRLSLFLTQRHGGTKVRNAPLMLAGPRQRFFPFLRASVPPCENPFYPQQAARPVAVRLSIFFSHKGTKAQRFGMRR